MRSALLFSVFVLLLALPLSGQTFRGALLGGANMSQIDGDGLSGFHQIGLNAGGRVTAVLSDRWQVGPEFIFSQQGSRRGAREFSATNYDLVRLNMVEVPLMVYFSDWKVQAGAGLSYSRLINYRVEDVTGEDITDLVTYRPDIISINFGGTIYFRPEMGLNVRWSKYLTDLEGDPANDRLLGRTVSIRLIYLLGAEAWSAEDF